MELKDKLRKFKNEILVAVAKEILVVERMDDVEIVNWRKEQCKSNKCGFYDDKNRFCNGCKCFIDAKAAMKKNDNPLKLFRTEVTHCPEGFWDDKEIANLYKYLDNKPLIK